VRVFVVMSGDRVTILSVRGGSRACLGGGVRVALVRRLSSLETLRVFPDADSFLSASQISTRGPPRKPHEMAQQVPAAVIPAGLEDEKKDKLKSVYEAMTSKATNTPQVCYHVLLAFEWNSEAAVEYLNGTPQQRAQMVLPAGLQGGNQGENPTLESVVTAGALTVADFPVSDAPLDDHANWDLAMKELLAFMNMLRHAVGVDTYAPDVLSVQTFRALLYQGVDDAQANVGAAPLRVSAEDQAAMEQRDPARNKKLRFAAYKAVVEVLQNITGEFRRERYPLGKFEYIIKLRYPERDRAHYSGFDDVTRAERRAGADPGGM